MCTAVAASNPGMEMLQFLHAQNPPCPWDQNATAMAATCGDTQMLGWMLAQETPCPCDHSMSEAARGGHLEVFQLLHSSGCSVGDAAYFHAADGGHKQVLSWLPGMKISAPQDPPTGWLRFSDPMLLFLGDIGAQLRDHQRARLLLLRRTACTFHGLLRWCCRAARGPYSGCPLCL